MSESLEGGEEFVAPGPGVVDSEVELSTSCGEAGGDVEEPVAKRFRFGFARLVVSSVFGMRMISVFPGEGWSGRWESNPHHQLGRLSPRRVL